MERMREILRTPADLGENLKDVVAIQKLHLSAADTVLRVQVKVDDQRLRRQNVDILPQILETLKAEKAKLSAIREGGK